MPKLLVFIVQPAAQYRHCSAAGFAVRRYLLSDCLLKSVSGRFKWGRWSPKVKYGPLLYRSISAHKKSTVMLLSTRDSWKNRFEKENIWTIPNLLSASRIVLSPVLCYLVLQQHYALGFGLLAVAGVSDLIDGAIARQYKSQASKLGSLLDPLADKCLVASLSISLTVVGLLPTVLTALILARDLTLISGAFYIRYVTLPPPRTWSRYWDIQRATVQVTPSLLGKLNTVLQLSLVGLSLGAPVLGYVDHPLLHMLGITTGITTLLSGIHYVKDLKGFKILRR